MPSSRSIQCPCGREHEWTAARAGSVVRCDCGANVAFASQEPAEAKRSWIDAGADGFLWSRSGRSNIVIGALCLAFAGWIYFNITRIEDLGQRPFARSSGFILRPIYNFAGKWGVVGILALLGIGFALVGVLAIRKRRAAARPDAPAAAPKP